jgi:hypothetical protein
MVVVLSSLLDAKWFGVPAELAPCTSDVQRNCCARCAVVRRGAFAPFMTRCCALSRVAWLVVM